MNTPEELLKLRTTAVAGSQVDSIFRAPGVFPSPVGPEQVELLNDMMRKIRIVTEEEGQRRGRPILIAARGIIDPQYTLRHRLDVKTWLAEDLIDILMPLHGGVPWGKHQGPLKAFVELAHRYGAPAYPCLRRVDKQDVGPSGVSWEICRGEAMSRFVEGADGITTFNRFDPTHRRWRELGDPKVLRDLDKTYTCPHDLPATVTDQGRKPLSLLVGDDVQSPAPANKRRVLKLRIHFSGLSAGHDLRVDLNGWTLEPQKTSPALGDNPQDVWLEFSPEPKLFKLGENLLATRVENADGTVKIDQVELDVFCVD